MSPIRCYFIVILIITLQFVTVPSYGQILETNGFTKVNDIVIDYDHQHIITVGDPVHPESYNLIIWDRVDGNYQPIYTFKADSFTEFYSVAYADNIIYAGGFNGQLFVFEYGEEWQFKGIKIVHSSGIDDIQIFSNSTFLLSGSDYVDLVQNGETIVRIDPGNEEHNLIQKSMLQLSTGQIIVRDYSELVRSYSATTGELVREYDAARDFTQRPGTQQLVLLKQGRINFWESGTINSTLQRPQNGVTGAAINLDIQFNYNSRFLGVVEDQFIEIYDMADESLLFSASIDVTSINTIEWLNDYQFLTGDSSGSVILWDIVRGVSNEFVSLFDGQENNRNLLLLDEVSPLIGIPIGILAVAIIVLMYYVFLRSEEKETGKQFIKRNSKVNRDPHYGELYPVEDE